MHINLDPIITKLFGKYALEYKGEYTEEREVSFLK